MDQCITRTHDLQHSPSVGGKDAELRVVYEALDGYPIIGNLDRFPSFASHGYAIGRVVMDHSIPSYLMVIGMMVSEVVVPALHVVVPAVVPFLDASVVSVQLVFVPSPFPDQAARLVAAPEV